MSSVSTDSTGRRTKVNVAAGETSAPIALAFQAVTLLPGETLANSVIVVCAPGAGGTMKAQATWSTTTDVTGNTANWLDWDSGTVSVNTGQALTQPLPTAVRFIATSASGVGEVAR